MSRPARSSAAAFAPGRAARAAAPER